MMHKLLKKHFSGLNSDYPNILWIYFFEKSMIGHFLKCMVGLGIRINHFLVYI